ncbi:MAG TPA: hypothetical protein V6C88_19760 [Chroococcidiopsis sp.]
MPKYRYNGDPTAIALPTAEGEPPQEVQLVPGAEVELPDDLLYVQRLIVKGRLEPIVADSAEVESVEAGAIATGRKAGKATTGGNG